MCIIAKGRDGSDGGCRGGGRRMSQRRAADVAAHTRFRATKRTPVAQRNRYARFPRLMRHPTAHMPDREPPSRAQPPFCDAAGENRSHERTCATPSGAAAQTGACERTRAPGTTPVAQRHRYARFLGFMWSMSSHMPDREPQGRAQPPPCDAVGENRSQAWTCATPSGTAAQTRTCVRICTPPRRPEAQIRPYARLSKRLRHITTQARAFEPPSRAQPPLCDAAGENRSHERTCAAPSGSATLSESATPSGSTPPHHAPPCPDSASERDPPADGAGPEDPPSHLAAQATKKPSRTGGRAKQVPGGDEGNRTLGLCHATAALSQLSYVPKNENLF